MKWLRYLASGLGGMLVLTLLVSLTSGPSPAQVTPSQPQPQPKPQPAAPPGKESSPWNSSTIPAPLRPPTADGSLSLRVYGPPTDRSPPAVQPWRNNEGYAVDVSAVMTRCEDGSLVITALVIGGQLTPLDNRCRSASGSNPAANPPSCDAKRWNCKTSEAQPAN